MIRIGLVGCGLVALGVHLKNLRGISGVEIAGLADPDPQKLTRAREIEPSLKTHSDYDALLANPAVDAVIVAVPYEEHVEVSLRALEHGKHIYLEKPFSTTIEDAEKLVTAWRATDLVGMLGFNYRFHPHFVELREMIQSGRIGTPVSLQSTFAFAPHDNVDWAITRHGEHGALFDLAPHHLDLSRVLLDAEIAEVSAHTRSIRAAPDTAVLQTRMSNAVLVQSFLPTDCSEDHQVTLFGTKGVLNAQPYRSSSIQFRPRKASDRSLTERVGQSFAWAANSGFVLNKLRSPWQEPSFLPAMQAFVAAVQGRQQVAPTFEDGYRSMLAIHAAEESIRSGRTVTVSAA